MNNNTSIIEAKGKNIETFLQNLITNDIYKLSRIPLIYSATLTPQGKFLYDFFLNKKKEVFYIETNTNEANDLINYFKRFDIRNDLLFEKKNNFICKTILYKYLNKDDKIHLKNKLHVNNEDYICFLDPRVNNFLIRYWVNENKVDNYKKLLQSDNDEIEIERIKKCLPNSEIDLEKNKSFILNFGMDKFNCVSFEKGCYVGQENTARQKYRGIQKYQLKSLMLSEGKFPSFNEDIYFNDKKIGKMKSFKNIYGLALIRNDIKLENIVTLEYGKKMKFSIKI